MVSLNASIQGVVLYEFILTYYKEIYYNDFALIFI